MDMNEEERKKYNAAFAEWCKTDEAKDFLPDSNDYAQCLTWARFHWQQLGCPGYINE